MSKEIKEKKPSAFNKPVKVSEALAQIVGHEPMPRTQVTKKLWEYIKKHNLQDPNNKRDIIPDTKLEKVLGSPQPINMFKLTSAISQHIHELKTSEPAAAAHATTPRSRS